MDRWFLWEPAFMPSEWRFSLLPRLLSRTLGGGHGAPERRRSKIGGPDQRTAGARSNRPGSEALHQRRRVLRRASTAIQVKLPDGGGSKQVRSALSHVRSVSSRRSISASTRV